METSGKGPGERIQHALEPWSPDFLATQQEADSELVHVWKWLIDGRPDWESVRRE